MAKANTVWVLTEYYNDYDQHGGYLIAVFDKKPDIATLAKFFEYTDTGAKNIMAALAFITHLAEGGGRRDYEHSWYELTELEYGVKFNG